MEVLNVFANELGQFGNPVGIVVDPEGKIGRAERQRMAKESGFSEVVFVNDLARNNISIYTPRREIPFAGHAAVGVAHFLSLEKLTSVTELVGIGGKIVTWQEERLTWVRCDLEITPSWKYEQHSTPEEVEIIRLADTRQKEHVVVWAWDDKERGIVRARTFAPDWGIPEDEANGSGCLKLAVNLGREIEVRHGKGSVVHARPAEEQGWGEVGGLVVVAS